MQKLQKIYAGVAEQAGALDSGRVTTVSLFKTKRWEIKYMSDKLIPFGNDGILKQPGDKLSAEKTSSGLEVLKINTAEIKESAVRYPSTGTIV